MQSYTAIIFSFLLLLGNAPSSQALITANEVELSSTFFRGSARTRTHQDRVRKRSIRAFVNTICTSELESDKCPHRGSGR
ncbi:MAG: hypothetical protein F6K54_01885 [Okeania sp. SIO3B5]|uniref:hypothetical protein n=1 Tax=Okeania sp. SIO3B5 TaxID=2607811 RepID=UPI0013FEC119|nr:hypothetical protein [Okeania sp. SIO3B5]NEO51948.1 hypothetical protein [Okeania sp. SIO3B5]